MNKLLILEGEKVILRPITFSDTDLIVKWRNSESVKANFIFQEVFTDRIHNEWMKYKVFSGCVVQYIIEDKLTKVPIGSVYFRDIDYELCRAEYGVFIGEVFARGHGYGSEVTKIFTRFGFNNLNLNYITLRVFADNIVAINSYISAGYKVSGFTLIEQNGKERPLLFMYVKRSIC